VCVLQVLLLFIVIAVCHLIFSARFLHIFSAACITYAGAI